MSKVTERAHCASRSSCWKLRTRERKSREGNAYETRELAKLLASDRTLRRVAENRHPPLCCCRCRQNRTASHSPLFDLGEVSES